MSALLLLLSKDGVLKIGASGDLGPTENDSFFTVWTSKNNLYSVFFKCRRLFGSYVKELGKIQHLLGLDLNKFAD